MNKLLYNKEKCFYGRFIMKFFDTICSISTPVGTGGIAVIRISGEEAFEICEKIFNSEFNKKISNMQGYTIALGNISDSEGHIIDQVLLSKFIKPNSFTGENVIEISCHGGLAVARMILKELIKSGARLAENGEFTKRAFLNGKIDLSQAEAIIDIINASDEYNVYSGENQLQGKLSQKINNIRQKLIDATANIIAVIDYPEEDIDELATNDIINLLKDAGNNIDELIKTYNTGKIIKEGAKIVIAGKPNVGKSSLLNALLKDNRAIVTDIAGTTRDTLEEAINIDGLKANIIDTAGIHKSSDIVESLGIEKAYEKIQDADLVLFIIDSSSNISQEDIEIANTVKNKNVFVILNKTDIPSDIDIADIKNIIEKARYISVSAKELTGINELTQQIKNTILNGDINIREDVYITNERHYEKLINSLSYIKKGIADLENGIFPDIVSIEIENAISALGEITGLTVSEEIISNIFSRFCLGK